MVLIVVVMVMTSGPATMNATPARLPALASGGGIDGMNPRAGATAVDAAATAGSADTPVDPASATPAAKPAKKVTKRAKTRKVAGGGTFKVGNASVPRNVTAGGIPSPAAGVNLAIAGGGTIDPASTGAVVMKGIPSSAAGEKLLPETLTYTPDDGATMARASNQRDAHAQDSHYGADTLPMEEPALPAMTPGAAAQQAERQVIRAKLSNGTASMPATNGGLIVAY